MITVIGAGPAGCYYASKVKNEDIIIFEDHKQIGKPVSCTGILTDSISEIFKVPSQLIVNKIKNFKIVSPNGKSLIVPMRRPNLILDRARFDQHMADLAIDNGAKIHLGERFLSYSKQNNSYIIQTSKKKYNSDMLVGADGPFSRVARQSGLYGNRKSVKGLQVRCKMQGLDAETTETRLGIGEFSWIVPEGDGIARVGIIGNDINIMKAELKKMIGKSRILEDQSGAIPLYNTLQKLSYDNVFLIGDAATQVKATTYGGILYGIHAAKLLAENKETYEKKFNSRFKKELWLSLKMRQYMNLMTAKDYNFIVDMFQKEKNKEILSKHDRDYPSKMILPLMLQEPSLVALGAKLAVKSLISLSSWKGNESRLGADMP
jgi:geranylgeranyl reductase family protein